jgi:hypothetical protein
MQIKISAMGRVFYTKTGQLQEFFIEFSLEFYAPAKKGCQSVKPPRLSPLSVAEKQKD